MAKQPSKMDRKLTRPTAKRPRPRDLPGLEDRHISEIVEAARAYIDARDERMEIGKTEKALKMQIIAMMHKHRKTIYRAEGIEIVLEPTDEKLTVTVKGPADAGDEEAEAEPENAGVVIRPGVITEH